MGSDQRKAIAAAALAAGATQAGAATEANCSESTVKRWLKEDPDFAALVEAGMPDVIELQTAARRQLAAELEASIGVLVALRDDADSSPALRERAARTLLDRSGIEPPKELLVRDLTVSAAVATLEAEVERLEAIED